MATKKITEQTLEELYQQKNKIKSAAIGLGIVMIVAVAVLFYIAITQKKYAFLGVAVGSSISFLPILISLKQINDEIKSRLKK